MSLTAEVSRNHSLLVEVQQTLRRSQETHLSFVEHGRTLELARLLRPFSVGGQRKVRVGSDNDGGYVLLDDLDSLSGVISGGAGDNVDFERDLASRGIPVHLYDHTVEGVPGGSASDLEFFREPIGPEGIPLSETVDRIAPSGDLLLKVDIDGGEWDLLIDGADTLPRFRQIAIELHGLHQVGESLWFEKATNALSALRRFHAPVHAHPNNHGAYAIVGGVPLPDILELTFARMDAFDLHEHQPPANLLDRPNHPGRPDYVLGLFGEEDATGPREGSDA